MRSSKRIVFTLVLVLSLTTIIQGNSLAASISGHVYEEGPTPNTPIPNVYVNIYTDRCHDGHLTGVQTDETGYYEFTGLPEDGQYIVQVSSTYYIAEWYDGIQVETGDCEDATFVAAGSTDIDFSLTLGGAISGTINNSSGPVTGVSVGVNVYAGDPCGYYEYFGGDWTNPADGTFMIAGVPEGTYFFAHIPC